MKKSTGVHRPVAPHLKDLAQDGAVAKAGWEAFSSTFRPSSMLATTNPDPGKTDSSDMKGHAASQQPTEAVAEELSRNSLPSPSLADQLSNHPTVAAMRASYGCKKADH
jgi:hypothetical protein